MINLRPLFFLVTFWFSLAGCHKKKPIPDDMIYIPKGEFFMGSKYAVNEIQDAYGYDFTESIKNVWEIELPLHKVKIDNGFYISKYELTVAEFGTFVRDTKYVTDAERELKSFGYDKNGNWSEIDSASWRSPGLWQIAPNQPVVCVSWNDAMEYVKWLCKKTGLIYRLPTEKEWEYACKAGANDNFTWGDDPALGMGKINGLDRYFGFDDGFKYVAPVGTYESNQNGLHDMLGNVWEWCSSKYVKQYPIDLNEPEPNDYVDRGGGWDSPPFNARISNRGAASSTFSSVNLGFRLVLDSSSFE